MKKLISLMTAAVLAPVLASAAPGLTSAVSELPLQLNDEKELKVSLTDGAAYKAIQLDICVPEGVTIPDGGVTLGQGCVTDHLLAMNKLTSKPNTYRVLAQSPSNNAFTSGTDLFTVTFRSDESLRGGTITFTDILMIDKDTPTETKAPADLVITIPTFNPAASISISGAAPVYIDESVQLTAVASPEGTEWQQLTWTSSDPTVASVDDNGLVTGLKEGSVTITATAVSFKRTLTATATVEVKGHRYGDANGDGKLTLADVNAVIAYILEMNPQPFSFVKADMNKDNKISVVDVTMITDELLKQPSGIAASFPKTNALWTGRLTRTPKGYDLELLLESDMSVNAMQADVTLPEGMTIGAVTLCDNADANVCTSTTPEGATRFIVYSPSLSRIKSEGNPVVKVSLLTSGELKSHAVVKVDASYASNLADGDFGMKGFSCEVNEMLGIGDITAEDAGAPAEYFTIEGRRVADPTAPGIYIVRQGGNTEKILVK